jgi:hypothetical protein
MTPGVFLSHNHSDKAFVRRLARDLAACGARVWLDEAEILLGDSLLQKIESAIREMDYLAVVLSPKSVTSEWVRREVEVAMTDEISGRRVKVLPLLIDDCDLPGFLQGKLFADFREDYSVALGQVLRRLGLPVVSGDRTEILEPLAEARANVLSGIAPTTHIIKIEAAVLTKVLDQVYGGDWTILPDWTLDSRPKHGQLDYDWTLIGVKLVKNSAAGVPFCREVDYIDAGLDELLRRIDELLGISRELAQAGTSYCLKGVWSGQPDQTTVPEVANDGDGVGLPPWRSVLLEYEQGRSGG